MVCGLRGSIVITFSSHAFERSLHYMLVETYATVFFDKRKCVFRVKTLISFELSILVIFVELTINCHFYIGHKSKKKKSNVLG